MLAPLRGGRSAIGHLTNVPIDKLAVTIGAQVPGFNPETHFESRKLAVLDRYAQLAVVAAREARAITGLDFRGELGSRTAAIVGSGVGGMETLDDSFRRLYAEGAKRSHPLTIPRLMMSAAPSHIAMEHGIRGPVFAVASACASANHAMGLAFQMVRAGTVEVAVAGARKRLLHRVRSWRETRCASWRRTPAGRFRWGARAWCWAKVPEWSCWKIWPVPGHAARRFLERSLASA
jgi:nodulation protein E